MVKQGPDLQLEQTQTNLISRCFNKLGPGWPSARWAKVDYREGTIIMGIIETLTLLLSRFARGPEKNVAFPTRDPKGVDKKM